MRVIAYFTIQELIECSFDRLSMLCDCLETPKTAISICGGLYTSRYDVMRRRLKAITQAGKPTCPADTPDEN